MHRIIMDKARNEKPLVSVIIATYNYGKYISETIESVLSQTYTNLEIIVIDDGSTDNTQEIVKQYPVKYVYQDHRGGPNAFNAGIRLSHGEFFTKPDADDVLHPRYVELCLSEMMKDNRVGFVWTAAKEFGDNNRLLKPSSLPYNFSVYAGPGGQLGAMLLRREAYAEIGGYDENLPFYEDWDLAIRLVQSGWKGKPVFTPIYFWRKHGTSRNEADSPDVHLKVLESKHPRMKLYLRLMRLYERANRLIFDPREAVERLAKKFRRYLLSIL